MVIAVVSADPVAGKCVESLRRTAGARDLELVILKGDPRAVFQLRAQGIAQASGERIAVLGDRYEVTAPWLNAIFEASEFDITGGCVAPAPSLNYWGWCVYLSEYAHIAPPVETGRTNEAKRIPGGNVFYKPSALRQTVPGETDLRLHSRLIHAGASAGILADLEVLFANPPGFFEYLHERFWLSRKIGAAGRVRKMLFAPLLPFVVLCRIGAVVMAKRRYGLRFLLCAPVIWLLGLVQAAGEFIGAGGKPSNP